MYKSHSDSLVLVLYNHEHFVHSAILSLQLNNTRTNMSDDRAGNSTDSNLMENIVAANKLRNYPFKGTDDVSNFKFDLEPHRLSSVGTEVNEDADFWIVRYRIFQEGEEPHWGTPKSGWDTGLGVSTQKELVKEAVTKVPGAQVQNYKLADQTMNFERRMTEILNEWNGEGVGAKWSMGDWQPISSPLGISFNRKSSLPTRSVRY
jgi:hypothetical protein